MKKRSLRGTLTISGLNLFAPELRPTASELYPELPTEKLTTTLPLDASDEISFSQDKKRNPKPTHNTNLFIAHNPLYFH
jgi:hypothetical protein